MHAELIKIHQFYPLDLTPVVEETYQETYRLLYQYTYRAIAHWTEPTETAKDLVQETYKRFIIILEREPSLAREVIMQGAAVRYLRGILKNLIREFTRSIRSATSTTSIQSILEQNLDIEDQLQASDQWASAMDVLDALKSLSEQQQKIIRMTVYGFSPEMIAAYLNSSVPAIRSSLYRARNYLRQCIKEESIRSQIKVQKEEEEQTSKSSAEVFSFVDCLSPAELRVFQLRELEQKSNKEIASLLCISEATVRAHYHRARKRVAAHLEQNKAKQEGEPFWTEKRIEQLPEKQRFIVTSRYVNGLSYTAIADQLGCSAKALQVQVCRAKQRILSREAMGHSQLGQGHRAHRLPPTYYSVLASIPREYRKEMLLFYQDGLSTKVIAERQGISESAVKGRLVRGRKALDQIVRERQV